MVIHSGTNSKSTSVSRKFIIAMALVIALEFITMIYFGTLKAGYHEDEYYSYFSSNRTNGFFYPDHEWVDTDDLRQEYVVRPGEGFQYSLVKLVQSWDVHPPLYYYVLHTVCSLTPGIFSKWQGLAVNLIFFVVLMILLAAVALTLTDGSENLALITCALYGFSPAAVSMVMFIRMYTMLTAAVLASAMVTLLFYRAARETMRGREQRKVFLYGGISAVITLLGFLTQYFYLIWIFFLTLTLGALLLYEDRCAAADSDMRKEGKRAGILGTGLHCFVIYCAGQAAAGLIGVLHYPASLSQIFSGYRGKEAQEAFADVTNIGTRISTFLKLIDQYLFNSIGMIVILVIAASLIYSAYQDRTDKQETGNKSGANLRHFAKTMPARQSERPGDGFSRTGYVLLLAIPVCGYFAAVAKTALLLGDSSLRYEMPILPLMMLFAVMGLDAALRRKNTLRVALTTAGMLLLGLSLYNLSQHKVLFLYEEESGRIETAAENHDSAAIVIYNPETPDNVARLTDQLLCYDELYYIDASDTAAIDDAKIAGSDPVMVYAADSDTTDAVLGRIAECMNEGERDTKSDDASGLVTVNTLYRKDMWTSYIFEK